MISMLPHVRSAPDVYPNPPQLTTSAGRKKSNAGVDATPRVSQKYDAFLVLDVEATCVPGGGFEWPNEIIEWPVCLMRWTNMTRDRKASRLEVVDEFRSFVRPTWNTKLSRFCTELTGITQEQVDNAPPFAEVLRAFSMFLARNSLIDPVTGERLARFCWCSDGPFDVRDFVVKQLFISQVPMPEWLKGNVLDVRMEVGFWAARTQSLSKGKRGKAKFEPTPWRRSLNISQQLQVLGLSSFQGRQHSGIDDTRNIARIVVELARRGVTLEPNTVIFPGRRWLWMGKSGEILEQNCMA